MDMSKFNQMVLAGTFAASGLLFAATPESAHAELRSVNQIVYGMDCAPCAFGTERRMKNIDAVTEVELSLNTGMVQLKLEPENDVTLHHIRDQIRRGGFSPREAEIEVVGELHVDEEGNRLLVTGTDEGFRLTLRERAEDEQASEAAEDAWQQLEAMEPGQRIVIRGLVPKTERRAELATLDLHVHQVDLAPDDDEQEQA